MCAREWLDSEMNTLMTLQIVIPVEALWALIALERPICSRLLLMIGVVAMAEEMRNICGVSAVEGLHHLGHSTDQSHLAVRISDVRINWRVIWVLDRIVEWSWICNMR